MQTSAYSATPETPRPLIPNRKTRKAGIQATRLPGDAPIDVRRMDFKQALSGPRYGYSSDPLTSHFFHTLSLLFPEGELFFMDSVRNYRKAITDPELKKQVKAFLSQEALHTKEHVAYNKRLEALGVDMDLLDKWLHVGFTAMKNRLPKKDQLAMTALMEHFTATLADEFLKNEKAQAIMDESIRPMWLWHAIEETEHKAVAFDVYRAIGGGEVRRLWAVPLTIATVGPMGVGVFLYLAYKDGQLTNVRSWRKLGNVLFRRPGVIRRTGPRLLGYRRMGFHPWHHNNYKRIEAWKAHFDGQYSVL